MRVLPLLLLLLAPAVSRAQSVEARLADLRLATAVRLALVQDAETRSLDVDVAAQNGEIRLSPSSSAALRVAQNVAGVRSVNGQGDAAPTPRAEPARAEAPAAAPRVEAPAPRAEAPVSAPAAAPAAPRGAWGAAPRAETPAETHVVGRGETLFSLARRYDTTVEALRRLNGLSATAGIEIGQRLRVR